MTPPRTCAWSAILTALVLLPICAQSAEVALPELSNLGFQSEPGFDRDIYETPNLNQSGLGLGGDAAPESTAGSVLGDPVPPQPSRILTGQWPRSEKGFSDPAAVAVDRSGNVYVIDQDNRRIQVYGSQMNHLRTIGVGWDVYGNGILRYPAGIALDNFGNIYMVDALRHRVRIFDAQGNHLKTLGAGQAASSNDGFNAPEGVAVDAQGNIYVADSGNHRVQIFDSKGDYQWTLGTGHETTNNDGFKHPAGVAVDHEGRIYVADTSNHRVQIFDSRGNYLRTLGTGQATSGNEGFCFPKSISVDGRGNIYVADAYLNERVQVFDAQWNYSKTLSMKVPSNGSVRDSYGIDVDNAGNIYVVDQPNHRIAVFHSIMLDPDRIKREINQTVKSSDWDGESGGGRFKIWDLSLGTARQQ